VCVVGAGAIGGLLGGKLTIAGQEVSLLARGAHLDAMSRGGLRLIDADGSETTATGFQASDDLADFGSQDLVILALKAHQITAVAPRLELLYGPDTVVMPIQSGIPWWFFQRFAGDHEGRTLRSLDPDGVITAAVPAERIVAGIAYPGVDRPAPGVVHGIEGDRLPVGELDDSRSERAGRMAAVLSEAGFHSSVVTNIRTHLWVKAWGNLAFNPISALTGATLTEITRHPATRSLAGHMMEEAKAIAVALGIRLPVTIEKRINAAEAVGDHKTSMLQDAEAGRTLELDPLVGVFVELGELTEVPTPTISAIYAVTKLAERQRATRTV
jgi:2-dehydropantoate 2-reductase